MGGGQEVSIRINVPIPISQDHFAACCSLRVMVMLGLVRIQRVGRGAQRLHVAVRKDPELRVDCLLYDMRERIIRAAVVERAEYCRVHNRKRILDAFVCVNDNGVRRVGGCRTRRQKGHNHRLRLHAVAQPPVCLCSQEARLFLLAHALLEVCSLSFVYVATTILAPFAATRRRQHPTSPPPLAPERRESRAGHVPRRHEPAFSRMLDLAPGDAAEGKEGCEEQASPHAKIEC